MFFENKFRSRCNGIISRVLKARVPAGTRLTWLDAGSGPEYKQSRQPVIWIPGHLGISSNACLRLR